MFKNFSYILFSLLIIVTIGCSNQNNKLTIGFVGNVTDELNIYILNSVTSTFKSFFYDYLVKINEDFTYESDIVILKSADQKEWKLKCLNKPILFHDGSKLNIHDIVFSIKSAFQYQDELQQYSKMVESVMVDEETNSIHIKLTQPYSDFPYLLSSVVLIKQQKIQGIESLTYSWDQINGTGPYQFNSKTPSLLEMKQFKSYFLGSSKVTTIQAMFYDDTEKLWNDLATHKIGMVNTLMMDHSRIEPILSEEALHPHKYLFPLCYALLFNSNKGFFANNEIRVAFDHYLNKEAIFNNALQQDGLIAQSTLQFVPFGSTCEKLAQRPELAKSFVESLQVNGYKLNESGALINDEGNPVVLKTIVGKGDLLGQMTIRSIMEQLLAVGIDLEIIEAEYETIINEYLLTGNFDMVFYFFRCEPYADFNYKFWHSNSIENGFNFGGYRNPKMDEALVRGRQAATRDDKIKAYTDFVSEFNKNPPACLLFYRNNYVITTNRLKNYHPHSMDWIAQPHLWSLKN